MKKLEIPEISDEKLEELYENIKPVMEREKELYWVHRPDSLRHIAFTWDPRLSNTPVKSLEKICTIKTLHTWAYYGFFKPTIAEVLSQVPENLINTAVAFSTKSPEDASELNKNKVELNAGFHVAETTLYKKATKKWYNFW